MKRLIFSISSCFALVIALTGVASNNVTAKALNASLADRGTGCFVRDADGEYWVDYSCNWHRVRRYDKDGNIIELRYQDQGTLPMDAPHPSQALQLSYTDEDGGVITETVMPSGEYKSSYVIRP